MKLKESKEKVPATFITTYIADAWDKVGTIKADIDAIKDIYTGTTVVVDCLQDIVDAYLIAAGRLQAFLDNKNYVTMPADDASKAITEALQEDANIDEVEIQIDNITVAPKLLDDDLEDEVQPVVTTRPTILNKQVQQKVHDVPADAFEFSCDFDEPELTQDDAAKVSQIVSANRV